MADEAQLPEASDIWHRTEERALINLVTPSLQARMMEASKAKPELFGLDEHELWRVLRGSNSSPNPTDNRLRLAFWVEYDRAQQSGEKMQMEYVWAGICTSEYFYRRYLNVPEKVAWLCTPPASYEVTLKESVNFGLKRMRDILDMDPEKEGFYGAARIKFLELQAKVFGMLDMRERGAFTQRSEVKTLNVHTTDKGVAKALMDNSVEAMEKRLKELEARERKALNLPEKKDDIVIK